MRNWFSRAGQGRQHQFLVTVPVVVMVSGRSGGLKLRWRAASVRGLAADDLKLDGGVVDVEAIREGAPDAVEDAPTL